MEAPNRSGHMTGTVMACCRAMRCASALADRTIPGNQIHSTPISATPTALPMTPRLTDDGRTLVLMEEMRAPSHQRQPEIRLGANENTGAPQVQVAGASICATSNHRHFLLAESAVDLAQQFLAGTTSKRRLI